MGPIYLLQYENAVLSATQKKAVSYSEHLSLNSFTLCPVSLALENGYLFPVLILLKYKPSPRLQDSEKADRLRQTVITSNDITFIHRYGK